MRCQVFVVIFFFLFTWYLFYLFIFILGKDYYAWEEPGIGRNLTYMIAVGIAAFATLLFIEYRIIAAVKYGLSRIFKRKLLPVIGKNDPDVLEERDRVEQMSATEIQSHNLVTKNMYKVYNKCVAVNGVSIGIHP